MTVPHHRQSRHIDGSSHQDETSRPELDCLATSTLPYASQVLPIWPSDTSVHQPQLGLQDPVPGILFPSATATDLPTIWKSIHASPIRTEYGRRQFAPCRQLRLACFPTSQEQRTFARHKERGNHRSHSGSNRHYTTQRQRG